ncbi:MAG: hypothetical protein SGARI_001954 [Bacillariaceae sp.]
MASSNDQQAEEKDLSAEERLQWLKDRGVLVETPEERKAAAAAVTSTATSSSAPKGDPITYVYIPADAGKPLQDCIFYPPAPTSSSSSSAPSFGGDPLSDYLKPAFATNADKIDLGLFQQSQDANPVHQLGTGSDGSTPKVSEETLKKVAKQGHVETFSLVHPTPGNKFTAVNMYLDEVGQMKRLPLNSRASDLAKTAGYNPPPIFYGDIRVAGGKPTYLDLTAQDCNCSNLPNAAAPWLQQAATDNLEHQMQFNQITGKQQGETQPTVAGSDGVAKAEEGYSWTQSEEEIELTVPLPSSSMDNITSKDIVVVFKARKVQVSLKKGGGDSSSSSKDPLVSIDIFERVDVDGCTWTIDKGKTGNSCLVVTLEKADEALWPRLEN